MHDILLTVVLILNPYISPLQQKTIAFQAVSEIRHETRIPLHIKRFVLLPFDPCHVESENFEALDLWLIEEIKLDCYDETFQRNELTFVMTPPFVDGTNKYFIGAANGICKQDGIAFASAFILRTNGRPGAYLSKTAMVHELGHLLGAKHTSTFSGHKPNIMNANVLFYAQDGILKFSRYQATSSIPRCVSRWRKGYERNRLSVRMPRVRQVNGYEKDVHL